MECHYQILGIELNADDDAIKKAYRKAALKYHPDKNLHCLEEATEKFRLVQAAYEVLSDPQERAWYDRHREEILHRKKYENYKENSIDLWEYFSPSAYKGFGDDENGFYAIYRDVFKKIDAEDQPFREQGSSDDEWMPSFGNSQSSYNDEVHEFYSAWQSYCTQLSYVWESQYDVKEAPNRRVARMIEKENKKERDKHKKKRNELVRELVAYVRKRDPRVKAHKAELEKLAIEQAKKAEEHRISVMRAKAEEAALYDEANRDELMKHNERVSELENMMKDEFGFSSSDDDGQNSEFDSQEDEEYCDDLFCVACNKLFKSAMGLRNHEKSKKHKESMNRLKQEMQEESTDHYIGEEPRCDEPPEDINEKSAKLSKKQKKRMQNMDRIKQKMQEESYENDIAEEPLGNKPSEDFDEIPTKMTKKQKKQKRQQQKLLNNTMDSQPFTVEQLEEFSTVDELATAELAGDGMNELTEPNHDTLNPDIEDDNAKPQPHLEANESDKKTRNKKNQQKKKDKPQTQSINSDLTAEPLGCGKCNQVFSSRNKLFQHLKKTGHSLALDNSKSNKRKNARNMR